MESFTVEEHPPQHKVIIHFHEADFHLSFVTNLIERCKSDNINVSITVDENKGTSLPVDEILQKIEESKIALVIFTHKYTDLIECSRELDKIDDCWEKGTLIVLSINYCTRPGSIADKSLDRLRDCFDIDKTVRLVKKNLNKISRDGGQVRLSKLLDSKQFLNYGVIPYKKRSTYKKMSTRETGSFELKDLNDMENMLRTDTGNRSSESEKNEEFVDRYPWEGHKVNENVKRCSLECLDWEGLKILFILLLGLYFCFEFHIQLGPYSFGTKRTAVTRPVLSSLGITEKVEDKSTSFCHSYERTNKAEDKDTNFYNSYERTEKVEGKDTNFCYSTCTKCPIGGKVKPPKIQVFINFRGDQLRRNFISYLVDALQRSEVNVFVDKKERKGEDLNKLFKRIEGSGIAIVVFSSRYAESHWCLDELVKIRERALEGLLKVLPIYYNVNVSNVKRLKGDFGDHFRDMELMYKCDQAKIKQWKEAISFVSQKFALSFNERSTELESEFVRTVVEEVLEILQDISTVKCSQSFGSE